MSARGVSRNVMIIFRRFLFALVAQWFLAVAFD